MRRRSISMILSLFLLILPLCFLLPADVNAEQTVFFETDFGGTPYTGMDPEDNNCVSYIVDKLCGEDFTLEAVINIRSIVRDNGRGVKFILRESPVASSGDLEVWLGHNDIWACTNGWKGNGVAKGFSIDPYLNADITVRVEIKDDLISMYLNDESVWSWEDTSFSAGGETNIEIGGWDSRYIIKSLRILPAPDKSATEEHLDPVPEMGGTTYYVDAFAPKGGDGLTPETAWNSIDQVNEHPAFLPDDQILFKRNCIWEGVTLSPRGSGIEGHPIVIDSYGEGQLPVLDRKGEFVHLGTNGTSTVMLVNQSYWTFRNIQISNHNPKNPGSLEDAYVTENRAEYPMRHGVVIMANFVAGYEKKVVRGITFENVVFDGVDTSHGDEGNCYYYRVKQVSTAAGGGALCFRAVDANSGASRAYIDGILVENCTFHNVGGTAISTGGGWKYYDTFRNLTVRGNRIYNDADIPLSCSGMYIVSTTAPLVEYNSIQDMTNGIGFQLCSDATAQYNTIVNMDGYLELTSRITGKAEYWDGCGIDTDCGCLGTSTIRGNYVEGCYAGSFAAFDYKDSLPAIIILEDNISYNCTKFLYYQCDNACYDFVIRNNTVVRMPGTSFTTSPSVIEIFNGALDKGSAFFSKNIFYYPNQLVVFPSAGCVYTGNNFTCINPNVKDSQLIDGEPMLNLPTSSTQTLNMSWDGSVGGTSSLLASKLFAHASECPLVQSGKVICGADLGVLSEDEVIPDLPDTNPPAGSYTWLIPALAAVLCGSITVIIVAIRKKR